MSLWRTIASGLRSLFRKDDIARDLDDEVRHYIEMSARENVRAGMSRSEAERAARIAFGGVEDAKERVRTAGWESVIDTIGQDLRFAIRGLRRSPGFTIVALITLALGVGANAAMFSVVNAVMLRPLPFRDSNRLALIYTDDARRGLHTEPTAYRTITDWQASSRAFGEIAYFSTQRVASIGNDPARTRERTRSALVSSNLFSVLGAAPMLGRAISAADLENRDRVAVISYSYWQRRFGGDSSVIGKTTSVEDPSKGSTAPLTIVGVMPADFYFPDKQTELWSPATLYWRFSRERSERFPDWARRWTAVARLASGATLDNARNDLARIGRQLTVANPSTVSDFPGFATTVVPLLDHVAGPGLQSALWILLGAVGLVLLVACVNVANLLLARGATRQREFAVRRALGAQRSRLVRQLLAESLILSGTGGMLGIVLATLATRVVAVAASAYLPRADEIVTDARVLVFTLVTSVVSGIAFGLVPAVRVSATDPSETLKEGGRGIGSARLRRSRGVLVTVECALAIVLLAGAGLFLKSLNRLNSVDPGFDPRGVLTMRIELPSEPPPSAEERLQTSQIAPARATGREATMQTLIERVAALPGVESVGVMDDLFIVGQGNKSITVPGRSDSVAAGELNEGYATTGYFSAMRVRLVRGRLLTRDDGAQKIRALWSPVPTQLSLAEKEMRAVPEPVVANESFVRRFFPNEDPLGKRFCIDPTNKTYWYIIVGVVADMHRSGLERRSIPEFYGPYLPSPNGRADLLVRAKGDPLQLAPSVRRAVVAAFPGVIVANVSTAEAQLGGFSAQRRLQTWVLTSFAGLALVLAAIGVYGLVHYAVSERTREIGVRVALGATASDVIELVIGEGMRLPVIGIVIGLAVSMILTRLIAHLLFDVGATDPATFVAVGLVLAVVAAAACYIPARRALGIDPMRALKPD